MIEKLDPENDWLVEKKRLMYLTSYLSSISVDWLNGVCVCVYKYSEREI